MSRARTIALAAAMLLAPACATRPELPAPSLLFVEVLRGFAPEQVMAADENAPVVVLVDASRSMAEQTRAGSSHHVAAQRAATRFVNAVSALRPIWLYAIGSTSSAECEVVSRGNRAPVAADRGELLSELTALRARGEGSIADALDGVLGELEAGEATSGGRVVLFSDLSRDCGGDLCAAAARLVGAGVRLDVVAIGDRPVPACLAQPGGLAESVPPPRAAAQPLKFRVEVSDPEPMVVGCSETGGLPVAAPKGPGTVVVELDPPLRVDARFQPGGRQVLQVLDFPLLDPPARRWRWVDLPPVSTEPGS